MGKLSFWPALFVGYGLLFTPQRAWAQKSMETDRLTSSAFLLGMVLLVAGVLLVLWSHRRTRKAGKDAKSIFATGVFALLVGGILAVTNLFRPASVASMDAMDGMEGMSMEEMMRVDGATNPTPVTVSAVQSGPFAAAVRYTGTVRPYLEVTVYPRVQGRLTDYSAYPGDRVVQGQVLARLSAEELTSDTHAAQAEAEAAQAELEANRAELAEHHQEVDRMKADYTYWAKELPRAQALLDRGVIAQEEFDKEKSQADAAQAGLRGIQLKLRRLQAQVVRAQAMVAQAQAKARSATVLKGYTVITSPITGIVQERMADPGVVVQPGMGILKVGDYSQVRLQANVAEPDLVNLQVGTPITARISSRNTVQGRITSIFPKAEDQTRTITVEALVDNPGNRLRAGQFLEMELVTGRKPNALTIPKTAVNTFEGKPTVWVVAGKLAQRKPITPGLTNGERVEVVSGLAAGETIITSGQERLTENTRIATVDDTGQPVVALGTSANTRIQRVDPTGKAQMGDNSLILEVQDAKTGQPVKVEHLEVNVAMPMNNMAPMAADTEVKPTGQPGRFQVNTYLSMQGAWEVAAKVKDKSRQGSNQFTLDNRQMKEPKP
ncbi:efflux RND transporter periplasmic adaptor subunit [Anthocerotibacter panamensis]|uniref:efflux RND transporter periplasmic adaptor subunit n=1 Tax=Anthocerotibacter panamensis TaxID=2857077 RepID=UPI001C403F58|nr:efflux RND transporter periplasmic adaptor subunit [Anthocerotibacter panamensis]